MENNDARFRKIEERMDRTDRLVDALHEEMTALAGKISALVDAQIRSEERLARLETAFVTFAELAKSMDERMDSSDRRADALQEEMAALTGKMAALVDAQIPGKLACRLRRPRYPRRRRQTEASRRSSWRTRPSKAGIPVRSSLRRTAARRDWHPFGRTPPELAP